MICTLSSAHWQQASKLSSPCGALSRFEKIEITAPINAIRYKRVTKCQFGHSESELLVPTESATKELSFDISFKTVANAKVKL